MCSQKTYFFSSIIKNMTILQMFWFFHFIIFFPFHLLGSSWREWQCHFPQRWSTWDSFGSKCLKRRNSVLIFMSSQSTRFSAHLVYFLYTIKNSLEYSKSDRITLILHSHSMQLSHILFPSLFNFFPYRTPFSGPQPNLPIWRTLITSSKY